jgi:hypothetical protein
MRTARKVWREAQVGGKQDTKEGDMRVGKGFYSAFSQSSCWTKATLLVRASQSRALEVFG